MIRTMLYRPATRQIATGAEELVDAWRQEPDAILWADLSDNPPQAERGMLVDSFGLHPLAVQDAQRSRHPPKLELFSDHVFILLKGLGAASAQTHFEFETIQIAMFIGDRYFVTRHSGPSLSIDRLWQALQDEPSGFAAGSDALALRLSRISIDRYLERLLMLEPRLEDLEQEIVAHPRDEVLAELIGYKTNLRKFRRVLVYHVQIFQELLSDPPAQIHAERVHEIRDVYEHQERASSLATLYYEVASDLIDGYISVASHRLNNIIRVLTIITAIFVPLSFLAGVYGMNFENMPELKSRAGYFVLLGVMGAIATVLLLLFRKRRWL
ncbi:magnesium/cobalt transporter CorA [Immundisolibacter sp.]|uniref:magnesium/cobalt transporter CorA n=2 Tax=Immundisolibacter sp. TaxID=1934948 RepID=UPI00356A14CD